MDFLWMSLPVVSPAWKKRAAYEEALLDTDADKSVTPEMGRLLSGWMDSRSIFALWETDIFFFLKSGFVDRFQCAVCHDIIGSTFMNK